MTYHVRRSDREITERRELFDIVKNGKIAVLGLCMHDEPYVVTLTYGFNYDDATLYFHCGKSGQKIDLLKANPRVCATIIEDNGIDTETCEHSYKSVVIRGKIVFVEDPAETAAAIRSMVSQLEKLNPDRFSTKLQKGNPSYDKLQILKLPIEQITGKARVRSVPASSGS
jgi:nitroimidazol reductase NimA-like FMN-containing flavoprotein (pyridoxamine 5'-phosphate oxidase superfamily)